MTPEQLAIVKADILATPALLVLYNAGDRAGLADAYNAPSNPAFVIYLTLLESDKIGPVLNYVAVSNLSTINRDRATTFLFLNPVAFSPAADIEAYWDTTFAGTLGGEGANTRAKLKALWRRVLTRAERLFATGTGTDAAPGKAGSFEGIVTPDLFVDV
jgi:hypothetical protein